MHTLSLLPDAVTPSSSTSGAPRIRVGIGGWVFEPWRDGNFFPVGWPKTKELAYASSKLSAIEINSTYYSDQRPSTFAKWHDDTPPGFMFSLKANRFTTNRRVLAEAGGSVEKFLASGLLELKDKLGPIVWQFAPSKRFDAADFGAFLKLLPRELGGRPLRHALDVRHESFRCPEYLDLARSMGMATVFTEADDYPPLPDLTADFAYCRFMRTASEQPEGCEPEVLDGLAKSVATWRDGQEPTGLPKVEAGPPPAELAHPRDVFFYFISGAKERNPAAAQALLSRLG
ncbi:DUF72 domain-containing protein [Ideonella azotifigens]|uniref:DUF72 domain-containing protein n=1 Tax=Ideonella azotifigens TaxID=513160 RepID=A0ABN1K829_9BURK|nr:DUF72 domain-containing protein [Ideonella azotifigens]MCD2342986.1 DUF72 domain-containing protein [Ideonella azotifigens]